MEFVGNALGKLCSLMVVAIAQTASSKIQKIIAIPSNLNVGPINFLINKLTNVSVLMDISGYLVNARNAHLEIYTILIVKPVK
jgi:hypothetical protein